MPRVENVPASRTTCSSKRAGSGRRGSLTPGHARRMTAREDARVPWHARRPGTVLSTPPWSGRSLGSAGSRRVTRPGRAPDSRGPASATSDQRCARRGRRDHDEQRRGGRAPGDGRERTRREDRPPVRASRSAGLDAPSRRGSALPTRARASQRDDGQRTAQRGPGRADLDERRSLRRDDDRPLARDRRAFGRSPTRRSAISCRRPCGRRSCAARRRVVRARRAAPRGGASSTGRRAAPARR